MINKKTWYKWHSLAGIKLSILICFILITGTLAVVSHEIDWLLNSSQRVIPSVSSDKIEWAKVYQSAQQTNNNHKIVNINSPIDDWFAVEVIKMNEEDKLYREFYHPITAKYQGDGRWYNWQRFFRMAHRHLMMPTNYGVTIVSSVGLIMFFSLISGLFMFPKWWKSFFRKPRTNNRKTFWNDCHRLFGLWASWLILVVSITGTWYLIEVWGGNSQFIKPDLPKFDKNLKEENPSQAAFEAALANVSKHHDFEIKNVLIVNHLIIIDGQDDTILVRDRANNVISDAKDGKYLAKRLASEQSMHVRISEAADPIHFGVFGGIYTKILYFLFGIILSSLAISGTYLYGMKQFKANKSEGSNSVLIIWKSSWTGIGKWRWPSLILLAITFILTALIFSNAVLI